MANTIPNSRYLIAYYLTLAVYFAASFFPEQRLWGINCWAYVDLLPRFLAFFVTLVLPFIVNIIRVPSSEGKIRQSSALWFGLVSVITVAATTAFYLYRVRTHFLGDGYLVLASLTENGVVRLWNTGVKFVQSSMFQLMDGSGEEVALLTFQLISYGVGAAFIVSASVAAYFFYSDNRERLLYLLITTTGGYSLLFFGYVENYPLFILVVLLYSLVGMAVARGKCNKWLILLPLLACSFIHIFAIALIPATCYFLIGKTTIATKWTETKLWLKMSIVGAVVLFGMALLFYAIGLSYFLQFAFVPFTENRFTVEGYWLFSVKHLLDIANLLLLFAPGLPIVLAIIYLPSIKNTIRRADSRFLLVLIVSSLGIIFLLDPKLGMPRDWDLFSFVGVPILLFTAVILIESNQKLSNRFKIASLVIALNLFILAPRVATQVNPERAIELIDSYAQLDKIKNRIGSSLVINYLRENGKSSESENHQATQNFRYPQESWIFPAQRLNSQGHTRQAVSAFERILKHDPSFYVAWANLGTAYVVLENYDSALTCLKIADGLNPWNVNTTTNIGGVYWEMGNQELAEKYWTDAIELNPDTLISRIFLLRLYQSQLRREDYVSTLAEIANHRNAPIDIMQLYSDILLKQGRYDSAAMMLSDALHKGLDTAYVRNKENQYPKLRVLVP